MDKFIHTDMACEECGGEIVLCTHRAELYCLECGLIKETEIPLSMLGYLEFATPDPITPSEQRAYAYHKWW